eukprot:scaffold22750_cov209-Cylindrotheca_fusiformis.AAC.3
MPLLKSCHKYNDRVRQETETYQDPRTSRGVHHGWVRFPTCMFPIYVTFAMFLVEADRNERQDDRT